MPAIDCAETVNALRRSFQSQKTKPRSWRLEQLKRLREMMSENEAAFADALRQDLGKSALESYLTETGFVVAEAGFAAKHLAEWMKPETVPTPLSLQPGRSKVIREPLGTALIIGAWNYPVAVTLAPLAGCIAAGNCAVIKPSELSPASSAAIAEAVPKYLDRDCFVVAEGGVPETTELLNQRFDKIFYTGGGVVGRIIMAAAAKHLTPVTLELGGKSPCIVDAKVNLGVAARRIAFGKFLNAGQTCVAPDYILVHRGREKELLQALSDAIARFYGTNPKESPDFGRIINQRHFDRLTGLLSSGAVVTGGDHDKEELYIAPTILTGVAPEAPIMREEIFGPILPVIPIDGIDEAIRFVNERDKPLALYLFSSDSRSVKRVTAETSAGGMCVNETLFHLAVPDLPFGGVGPSGMGRYHGRWGFEAFSHVKAVLSHSTISDPSLRYPPYSNTDAKMMRWSMRG